MADLIALTDDAGTGYLDTTILNQVIENASGKIDQFVGAVYDVPFNPVPPSVVPMAITIACYRLLRRRETPDEKNKFYEEYKDVIEFLKGVQSRDNTLDLSIEDDFSQIQANLRGTIYAAAGGNVLSNSM